MERADGEGAPARYAYALHVIDPTTGKRHTGEIIALLLGLTGAVSPGTDAVAKVTLEIVKRGTQQPAVTMREYPDTAHRLAEMIAADLDRLDATGFEAEWGIKPST